MFIVNFSGPFGFIKPWTAVRDSETFSQQFLTPSIVEGMEKKLFPELLGNNGIRKILRHRLTFLSMSKQQEVIHPRGMKVKINKKAGVMNIERERSILARMILINPTLYLAFANIDDAKIAASQHLCLTRNEDVILPDEEIIECSEDEFDDPIGQFKGFELIFDKSDNAFIVGGNRFKQGELMYGNIKIVGENPLKIKYE